MFNENVPVVECDRICAEVVAFRSEAKRQIDLLVNECKYGSLSADGFFGKMSSISAQVIGMYDLLKRLDIISEDEFEELKDGMVGVTMGAIGECENG